MADLSKIRKNGVDYNLKDTAARADIEELKKNGTGGTGVVKSDTITTIWTGTQQEYDAITEKSDTTLYMIKEVV